MKALTLWRPWAAAVVHGTKRVENRTWVPQREMLGQDIALHAGKTVDDDVIDEIVGSGVSRDRLPGPTGIVAVVRLVGVIDVRGTRLIFAGLSADEAMDAALSDWFDGDIGWVLDRVRPLAEPVPCRGAQGLWTVPDDVAAEVARKMMPALPDVPHVGGKGGAT